MSRPICRTCGFGCTRLIGSLPDGFSFAGRTLEHRLSGGSLWQCESCHFVFRHPLHADSVYESLYRTGTLGLWDSTHHREDFRLITQGVMSWGRSAVDVLDIGCYTGQLLASFPGSYRRFGVEPNTEAVAVAASRGVAIVAKTVAELSSSAHRYDLITACDVIEHVPDPLALLGQLRSCLKSNGRLIITTGNADARLWRIVGADFWYCRFPEHISFIGTRWVRAMPPRIGLKLVDLRSFNYRGGSINTPRLLAALLHKALPRLYRPLRQAFAREPIGDVPPGSGATKDHMICTFEISSGQ